MSTTTKVEGKAANRKGGMTFEEIAAWVDEGRRLGVASSTIPKMTSTWRQSIQSLSVQVEVDCGG